MVYLVLSKGLLHANRNNDARACVISQVRNYKYMKLPVLQVWGSNYSGRDLQNDCNILSRKGAHYGLSRAATN